MENLEKMIELVDAEFGSVAKNGKFRSREEIESVYQLMDIAKDAFCIMEYESDIGEDDMSYNYSNRNGGRMMYRGNSYDDGSYARGRGRNAKRDSMGRYSREGSYRDGSYRGYSRGDGKEEFMENLRSMMEEAPDEKTRQDIQRMIQQMNG